MNAASHAIATLVMATVLVVLIVGAAMVLDTIAALFLVSFVVSFVVAMIRTLTTRPQAATR